MPDHGRPAEEVERRLERSLAIYPELDHGSTLLARGLPSHPPSGGRKVNGGIMMRAGYKGPTVNIRPPKWTDNMFWLKADNYRDAQYIADAVYHHIGRGPFHFPDANFQYPPLRLETRELLTREMCSAYVESIAKGSASQRQREDYKERVKELVLKAVKSPEAVLFLSSLRPIAQSEAIPEASEESEFVDYRNNAVEDRNEAVSIEEESHFAGLPAEERFETPMEVDHLSEQAIQVLDSGPVDLAYIASFGLDWFDSANILQSDLQSDLQSLGAGWSHLGGNAGEPTTPDNLKYFLMALDEYEEELSMSTESSCWIPWCPLPNISHYSLRYNRVI